MRTANVNSFVVARIVSDVASFVKTPISRVVEVLVQVRPASRKRHVSSAWLEGAEEQGGGGGASACMAAVHASGKKPVKLLDNF